MTNKIIRLIEEYSKKHNLAKECGGEYISQDDKAQVDAIELVCDIFDLYANEKVNGIIIPPKTITLSEFKEYELEDINYNGSVYCFTEEIEKDVIKKLESFNLGKQYRYKNVKENNLFYVENCDICDITNARYDSLASVLAIEGFELTCIVEDEYNNIECWESE